jgi:ribulose-5-phosphate 4-epimerase/fuculose-1-phosphate aldolase
MRRPVASVRSEKGSRMTIEISATPERTAAQRSLLRALRVLARLGYSEGIAGHVTVRDPEYQDHYWVNPFCVDFTAVTADDLQLTGPNGEVVLGGGRTNPSVHPLHGELHRARPELAAFVHSHSMYGKTWSALGRLLDPITQDACALYERHAVHRFRGLISEVEEGKEIAAALGGNIALVLANHGFIAGGHSVEEATWWFVVMERCARSQLLAEATGTPVLRIDEAVARETGAALASAEYARIQFDNLYRSLFLPYAPIEEPAA